MKKQLIHASVFQNSKIMAIFYFIFVALIAFPYGLYTLWIGYPESWVFFLAPFFYLFFGFITTAFGSWMYNLVAATFGGLEFTFKDSE